MLDFQLSTFIYGMRHNDNFTNVDNFRGFTRKMVTIGIRAIFLLIYHLIKVALVLPITTTSVEKLFLAMDTLKIYFVQQNGRQEDKR